jgi:transcriptional regulator with XRE-family HTH domain
MRERPKKVNVHRDRLRAAREANELRSWQQLARAARVSHSALSRLRSARRQTGTVRAVTLERLARALKVPAEWLTGEQKHLPYVPEWDFGQRAGEGESHWERPTAADVRWSWLMQRAEAAVRRDLDDWFVQEAQNVYDSWGHSLMVVIVRLASSNAWRSVTLKRSPERGGRPLWQSDDARSVDWLEHVLELWLDGTAYLNAGALRSVFEAIRAETDVQLLGSDTADRDALQALERYAARWQELEQARLEALGPEED